MDKHEIRQKILNIRRAMTPEQILIKSNKIFERVKSLGLGFIGSSVLIYVSFENEVMTSDIINYLLANGVCVSVPVVVKNAGLEARSFISLDNCQRSSFGIMEPITLDTVKCEELDTIFIPGLAFDRNMHRIGFGKAYYDTFLSKTNTDTKKIALAYDYQVLDSIPAKAHDVSMDMIITENEIIS